MTCGLAELMNAPDAIFARDKLIASEADRLESAVIAWRRDIHANPELGGIKD
jgi:amidohydrolase